MPEQSLPERFSASEEKRIARSFASGRAPECPRCASALDVRPVPPRTDVSYVRDRVWLTCPSCHRGVVIDRRETG